jgi:hypothetical protein
MAGVSHCPLRPADVYGHLNHWGRPDQQTMGGVPRYINGDDIETNSALPFETRQEMEIADILSGSLTVRQIDRVQTTSKLLELVQSIGHQGWQCITAIGES